MGLAGSCSITLGVTQILPLGGRCVPHLLVCWQVPIAEAGALCRHEWMRQALCIWLQRSGLQQGVNGNGR